MINIDALAKQEIIIMNRLNITPNRRISNNSYWQGDSMDNSPEQDQYFYHADHLGSSSWITDASGNVNQHLAYMPYGEQFIDERNTDNHDIRFKFTGKERDTEIKPLGADSPNTTENKLFMRQTGLDYFGARYYSSGLSVWLSVDPLASRFTNVSAYIYCVANPIKFTDEDGLWPKPFRVTMDDGSKIWVITYTNDGQKFSFFSWKNGFKNFNYRSANKKRKSLALLKDGRSEELSENMDDINKMEEFYGDYKITKILSALTEQYDNIKLHVIGNHAVPHALYYSAFQLYDKVRVNNNSKILSLNTHDDIVYVTASGVKATYYNRTLEIDSQWAKDRAQFIVDKFFDGLKSIDVQSRYDVSNNIINGIHLAQFGHDAVGITIGISLSKKNRKITPERHKTVLFL